MRCNGMWMSRLEQLAMRFTAPLILGYAPILTPFGQYVVSALLCLIAMRLEFLGDMRAISIEDRDWLRYYSEPNQNWKIWIAHFDGSDQDQHWSRTYGIQHGGSTPPDSVGPGYCDTRISTLVMGQLCAHIFYSQDTELASKIAYDGIQLMQLWPASQFDLHTIGMHGLSGRDVLWLHEAYAREAPRPPHHG
jgi:hypothetical protein